MTIWYAGLLVCRDKWIVEQASDVPSVIFFIISHRFIATVRKKFCNPSFSLNENSNSLRSNNLFFLRKMNSNMWSEKLLKPNDFSYQSYFALDQTGKTNRFFHDCWILLFPWINKRYSFSGLADFEILFWLKHSWAYLASHKLSNNLTINH